MKLKRMWIPFALLMVIALPVRLYQTLSKQDPLNLFGMQISSYNVTLSLLGLVGVFVLCFIIMSVRAKNANNSFTLPKNILAGIFVLLSGILLLADSANRLAAGFSSNVLADIVVCILSILSGVIFLLLAVEAFSGRKLSQKVPILMLFPTIWACARLVKTFFLYTNIASISENMFDIISLIFLLLFLFLQAKLQAGFQRVSSAKKAMVFGLPSVVLLLMYSLPNLLLAFSSENGGGITSLLTYGADACVALYIFCYLVGLTAGLSKAEKMAIEGEYVPLEAKTEEFETSRILSIDEKETPPVGAYSDEHVVDEILNHYDVATNMQAKPQNTPIPLTPKVKEKSTLSQIDKLIDEICAEENLTFPKDSNEEKQ